MKQLLFTSFLLFFSMMIFGQTKIPTKVKTSAENKTSSEISKKVNKGIEGIFNPKKKKKKKNKEEEAQEKDNAENNNNQPNDSTNQGDGKANNEEGTTTEPAEKEEPVLVTNRNDFIPGDKLIFVDSLKRELMGEFPSKWDLETGSVENMNFGKSNVIGFVSGATIFPLMTKEDYLPEMFTVEFDCYFHNYGNEGYTLQFNNSAGSIRVNNDRAHFKGSATFTKNRHPGPGWRQVSISFNKRALKLYLDGERLLNIPNVKNKPTSFKLTALSPGISKNQFAMIRNVRVAEGGVPLYNRLLTEGKIVTNNIHFDYNKATLKSESMPEIRKIAQLLNEYPDIRIRVEGHTDSGGSEEFNLGLSEKRAETVKGALIAEGIDSSRLESKGLGKVCRLVLKILTRPVLKTDE